MKELAVKYTNHTHDILSVELPMAEMLKFAKRICAERGLVLPEADWRFVTSGIPDGNNSIYLRATHYVRHEETGPSALTDFSKEDDGAAPQCESVA